SGAASVRGRACGRASPPRRRARRSYNGAMTFPITPLLPQIQRSLAGHPRLVLEAPPGAGKTTQVPLALLDAPWLAGGRIVMLEPRRVAARSAAMFMARQLGEEVGGTVGYRIRFEKRVSARTRIEVVTEGILTRMLQDDPMLEGIGALVFDEFHERHLAGDLGLALALDVQAGLREDLRLLVMSATLDGERLAAFLDAPRLTSAGRSFDVQVAFFPARREEALEVQARRAVEHALARHPGDVLVFLPGRREIARLAAALARPDAAALTDTAAVDVLELHGDLPVEQPARVLQPAADGRRRVVLATNVAESSVTLPGVRVVIDSGLAREPRYDPNSGFSRLEVVAISQASADQRAGRAGRVAEGWAYRLWPQSQRLEPQRRAEIGQSELAPLALELAAWGSDALRFVDPPPPGAMAAARDLLRRLEALDEGGAITAPGRRMLALGTHPRLAAMLLAESGGTERALACDLAALVEARDPLRTRGDGWRQRWLALAAFRGGRLQADANRATLAAIDQAARQWRRRLGLDGAPPADASAHALGALLARAFPDRIGRAPPRHRLRSPLSHGRPARPRPGHRLRRRGRPPATTGSAARLRAIGCATRSATAAWRAWPTTAACAARPGWWPANCAWKRATRWCCAARRSTRRRCARPSANASSNATKCAGMPAAAPWWPNACAGSTASCSTRGPPAASIRRRPR